MNFPLSKRMKYWAHVISDSICMSSYKASIQGADHKRVPNDVSENPVIIGHEFCGEIVEVGKKWQNQFKPGDKFSIQPAINNEGSLAAPIFLPLYRRRRNLYRNSGRSYGIRLPSQI